MPDLDSSPARTLDAGVRTLEPDRSPDPVETLAQVSGVSAEALRALGPEEREGMASLEASVTHAVEASRNRPRP